MDNETLHTLLPFEDFKTVLGIDDREDAMSHYCLITATYTIEQYCKRRLFAKKHFERIEPDGDLSLYLREYPVREILALYALFHTTEPELIEPELYAILPEPEPETEEEGWPGLDIPHELRLSPALGRLPGGADGFQGGVPGRVWLRQGSVRSGLGLP
jgi:hypothetical protein